ncbi:MAG: MbcA/ParS/Xre antitoxin family protein [Pseudohongiella sp.]|nr:MbcA/ParS/Xre antitoxin family protein [Pseudohongiella sp.]
MDSDEIHVDTQTEVIDDSLCLRNDVPVGKLLAMIKILFNQWNINHIDQATLLGMGETEYAMLLFDKFDQTELENREIPVRIYYLLGINAILRALFGSSDVASRWMLTQNEALDAMKPIQIIERDGVAGIIRMTRYLNFYVFS